jgi:ribosomal protein S18 acetylase RimI-like enzyme
MALKGSSGKLCVRQAIERDKAKLANLIHFETYIHRHLDWRSPLDWIGSHPFLISESNDQMVGAIACPPDPPSVAWIRLFALSSQIPLGKGWEVLWQETKEILLENHSMKIFAIPLQEWFENLLKSSKFFHTRDVVIFAWENREDLPPPNHRVAIRAMNIRDLASIHEIDSLAFEDEWQNTIESIEVAFQQASVATVAVSDEKILGYQISTGGSHGGHLARLAVRPEQQMKGIGYSLVYDLITQFQRRGVTRVTVNTQQDNIASINLYGKAKFSATGEVFPVYQYQKG